MKLPASSRLAKGNAVLAFVALIVYIAGFASPDWLKKDFMFPINKAGIVALPIKANIGLFRACKVETYPNGKSSEGCSPDGAADWQFISAVMAIAGLVLGLVGVVLSVLSVATRRLADKPRIKFVIAFFHFIACIFYVGPLLMFPINKTIQVKPDLSPFKVDFDLGIAYILAAVGSGLFAVLVLLNSIDIILSSPYEENKDDKIALSKDRSGFK